MKYCPECGSALGRRLEGGRERPACPTCSFIHFGQFSIGVGGVVIRDGKVLLIQRGQDPGKGWWQIPGGYAEQDENIDVAVEREIFEETGVRARPVRVVGLRHGIGPSGTNVYVVFLMEPEEGEPRPDGEEISDARFYTLEEIASLEQLYNVNRWAIRTALSAPEGLIRVEAPEVIRPGSVTFGMPIGIGPSG